MAVKDERGNWIDAKGDAIPPKYIDPVDKKRDVLVEKLIRKAVKLSKALAEFKEEAFDEIEKYLSWVKEKYGVNLYTDKGNKQLSNFSNTQRIDVLVASIVEFDERIAMAKQLIDECIHEWSGGANDKIRMLVEHAFKVDKKGNLDKQRILSLKQLKINDKKWKRAMELINDSLKIVNKRRYIRFLVKNEKGEFETIFLDIAKL